MLSDVDAASGVARVSWSLSKIYSYRAAAETDGAVLFIDDRPDQDVDEVIPGTRVAVLNAAFLERGVAVSVTVGDTWRVLLVKLAAALGTPNFDPVHHI